MDIGYGPEVRGSPGDQDMDHCPWSSMSVGFALQEAVELGRDPLDWPLSLDFLTSLVSSFLIFRAGIAILPWEAC